MKYVLRPLLHSSRSLTLGRYMMSTEATERPVECAIRQKILESFSSTPNIHLNVVNESHKHNVPKGSESHFNVLVVSDAFEGEISGVALKIIFVETRSNLQSIEY